MLGAFDASLANTRTYNMIDNRFLGKYKPENRIPVEDAMGGLDTLWWDNPRRPGFKMKPSKNVNSSMDDILSKKSFNSRASNS
jgi:hypothetical protein